MNETNSYALQRLVQLGGLGVLAVADIDELNAGVRRVLALMADGAWHSADQIRAAAGGSEGLRRMRELREHFEVDRHRSPYSRTFFYKLRPKVVGPERQLKLVP